MLATFSHNISLLIPAHDNTGERSSQYAAENSCRTRYAPFTDWIATFDTDEYMIPMGDYADMKDVMRNVAKTGTKILSFRSSRGKLRFQHCLEQPDGTWIKKPEATFLEAYNCDSAGIPKPAFAERARKQIYQADYVLYHWIHYATITKGMLDTYKDIPSSWTAPFGEHAPVERRAEESQEALMVHTKLITRDQTKFYKDTCHKDYHIKKRRRDCWMAFPWPKECNRTNRGGDGGPFDKEGMLYNCFVNEKVETYWIPRLRRAMQ